MILKDCCKFQEGYVNPTQKKMEYFDGKIKWLRSMDLNNGYIYDTSRTLTEEGFKSAGKSAYLFPKDSIAISKSGTIGQLGIIKNEMCGNRAVINIIVNNKMADLYYIFYLLQFKKIEIINKAVGSIQKNLYISALEKVSINHSDLTEQVNIGKTIRLIDDKIDLNNKCISKLEQMMKDIYDYWFVQFDFPNEKGKPYKSSGGKMVYNEKLKREIPAIFEIKTAEDFCEIFTGKKDVNKSLDNGKYKFFSCAPEFRYSNEYLYDGKAILVSGNGSYTGRTIFVNDKFDLYQRTYAIVNKDDTQDIIEYIYLSLKTYFVLKVKGGTHGSAIPYIVYNDIANEPILYNKEIIMKFIDIVKQLLQKIVAIKNQNDKLKEYKNFILPLLMNGQVEVK